ncbi:Mannose-1-phosphate guanylyltransferase 1 [compost metagenome]
MAVIPVIMAGGSGSRLWPMSREHFPKQFLNLYGHNSMLQETVNRLADIECTAPLILCNEKHRFIVAEQLRQLNILANNIILEPVGRNTAPAIALAAIQSLKDAGDAHDPILLVLAADHLIQDQQAFTNAINSAIPFAESGKLVTFGIVPNSPETGYGYIHRGSELHAHQKYSKAYCVNQFVEKPNLDIAKAYLASGEYYWNSGMFMFSARRYLVELKNSRPDIYDACMASMDDVRSDLDFIRINHDAFSECPSDSIDYAIMEKTSDAIVVPMDAGWNDVGSWSSLWDISEKDSCGNVCRGDVILTESHNNYVSAESVLVSTIGVDNLVIIQTKDAILVASKDKVQDVKSIVEELKRRGRKEYRTHREVYRPWGQYDSIDDGNGYQVKKILIRPGERLSTQMHHHRAEHWIVVSGTAKVINAEREFLITENESTFIPIGAIHSLENPGKVDLELIEIRSGRYLDEDDIVRLSDKYGRVDGGKYD